MVRPSYTAGDDPTRDPANGQLTGRAPNPRRDQIRADLGEIASTAEGGPLSDPDPELARLMDGVRAGDREAGAKFIARFGSRIRRRVRGKLSPAMRRLFDSQEILATVARRLDVLVAKGEIRAVSDGEVWELVFTIVDHSLVDKARVYEGLQAKEGEDSGLAEVLLSRFRAAERSRHDGPEVEIDKALRTLGDRIDRQILTLWLMGRDTSCIAIAVDMDPAAVRKRWQRIRGQLRAAYLSGDC